MSDLLTQPAVDLLALLEARKISALELAELHIQRIELLNPQLNAVIDYDPEEIRRASDCARCSTAPRGPLHGLPLTVKSSISVAGRLCETGSLLNQGSVQRVMLRPSSACATPVR